jgi:antitoxin component HigA of HigAB toxin-antitoxin module
MRNIAAICSEAELAEATRELCALMSKRRFSASEEERFQDLVSIVEEYERAHHPIADPSHGALLEHLLEAKEITAAGLAKATEIPRRDIEAILKGKRDIAAKEAAALARYFHLESSIFLFTAARRRSDGPGRVASSRRRPPSR